MLQRLQDIGGKKSMNRIYKAFENKKAFIGFLTAGDPVIDKTVDYILDMEQAGASLIEIGIPFCISFLIQLLKDQPFKKQMYVL